MLTLSLTLNLTLKLTKSLFPGIQSLQGSGSHNSIYLSIYPSTYPSVDLSSVCTYRHTGRMYVCMYDMRTPSRGGGCGGSGGVGLEHSPKIGSGNSGRQSHLPPSPGTITRRSSYDIETSRQMGVSENRGT